MSNFIQNLFPIISAIFILSGILRLSASSSKGEEITESKSEKITEKYRTDEFPPDTFISNQQGIFKNTASETGIVVIRPLNVGVSEKGLYLFQPHPYNILFPSLLIPWEEIEYQRPTNNGNKNKPHTFYLGDSKITSLRLYPSTIKKLEEDYGEPIFSNKLGELS